MVWKLKFSLFKQATKSPSWWKFLSAAKRILERHGIQTSSSFVKIWLVCIPEFKTNLLFFCHLYGLGFFLSKIYWGSLDHDLMASIWEKAISILAGNLNSSRSYLITAVNVKAPGTSLKIFVTLLKNLIFNKNSRKNAGYQQYECSFRKDCNSLSLAHQLALARGGIGNGFCAKKCACPYTQRCQISVLHVYFVEKNHVYQDNRHQH